MPQVVPANEHPIRLRTKYPGNRDIRSDVPTFDDESNSTANLPTGGVPQNNLEKDEPLSLWDLEREKEERDAMQKQQQQQNYEMPEQQPQQLANSQLEEMIEEVAKEKRKRSDKSANLENDNWFLASISSTGVLMKSLNNTRSSIDFAFVLNIRESEAYPPLFKPQDLNCVEEKISAYKSEFLYEDFLVFCIII